jgi:hypothetical protein
MKCGRALDDSELGAGRTLEPEGDLLVSIGRSVDRVIGLRQAQPKPVQGGTQSDVNP